MIENIIQDVGINYVWLLIMMFKIWNLSTNFKALLLDYNANFFQNLNKDIYNSPKCLNYRLFKTTFTFDIF